MRTVAILAKPAKTTGFEEGKQAQLGGRDWLAGARDVLRERVRLGEGGRLVVPAAMRERLGIKPGDEVSLELEDGVLKVRSYPAVIKEIQDRLQGLVPQERSVVDEFIDERRQEQQRVDDRFERLHREGTAQRDEDD